jgi:hypothetical protein
MIAWQIAPGQMEPVRHAIIPSQMPSGNAKTD